MMKSKRILKFPREIYDRYWYAQPEEGILNEDEKFVTTRKEHTCCDCGNIIQKGDYAKRHTGLIPGEGRGSFYICIDCVEKILSENLGQYIFM